MNNFLKKMHLKRKLIVYLAKMHFYGNPSAKLKIVGITGTNGKTTVATILFRVATKLGYKCGLIGTVENIIIDKKIPATHTTPDGRQLYKLLNEMVDRGCEYVFIEVSSHAIDQDRIAGVKFTGGVFTNLTHDHLDYHKSIENYFLAKKKFFDSLPSDAFALSNIDDEHGKKILENTKAEKHFYGFKDTQTEFKKRLETSLLGEFNAYNALAVFGVCKLLNFNENKVRDILKTIEPPAGRFEYFISKEGVMGVVDFAHTPDAVEKVISTARGILKNNGRIITIFGCGGDRDPLKRRIMGKIGVNLSDIAIITSDNPRSENPDKIIAEIKTDLTMNDLDKVKTYTDRGQAILEAGKIVEKDDIVLLLGKGHENYQEIKGTKYIWSDLEKLKQALD